MHDRDNSSLRCRLVMAPVIQADRPEIDVVGVIIPTFNRCGFLRESLASVLSQSYQNLEILVIDNGSTDGTPEFLTSIRDPRVRYLVNDHNIGLAGSLNRGFWLFAESVQWCAILCDDDRLEVSFVETAVRTVKSASAQSIVYGSIDFVDCTGKPMRHSYPAPSEETAFDYLANRLRCRRETYLSGVFVNCRAAREIGGYPLFKTGLVCDDAFIFSLALLDRLCFARDAKVYVRIHDGAESQEIGRIVDHLQAIDDFKNYVVSKTALVSLTCHREKQFRKKLDIYTKQLRGIMFLRGIHSCFDGHVKQVDVDDLNNLVDLVAGREQEFPQRIKIFLFLRKSLHFNIESSGLYRKICIGIVRLLRRFLW